MTNPTADAIAALSLAHSMIVDGIRERAPFSNSDPEQDPSVLKIDCARSALLAAQGQAGKPVMTALLVKLASIAVHAEEGLGPHAHPFDLDAVRSLLTDPEIRAFLDDPKNSAFLPLKRNSTEKDDGHGRG